MELEKLFILIILHNQTKKNRKMNKINIRYVFSLFVAFSLALTGCQEESYSLGDLNAPTNVVITTQVVGQNTANPSGDGSGDVKISVSGSNTIAYKIGYNDVTDLTSPLTLSQLSGSEVTKKFTALGVHTYRITVVAFGAGGTSTNVTKEVTVKSTFSPDASTITYLTNDANKTWVVDKSVPGHFGVGPWSTSSTGPDWWSAAIDEKVTCCNCFYTTTFKFTKVTSSNSYTLQVTNPDGAFTKTGSLASIPGIPSSGAEGCYPYSGGTSAFSFVPPSSNVTYATMNKQTAIQLDGNTTYIGYGALQREFQFISISANAMYLRVQGTETGNAWYLKLKPAP